MTKNIRCYFIFLLVLWSIPQLYAQENGLIIKGVVKDKLENTPIPYATIALGNNRLGTISNESGEFRLILPKKYGNETIVISHIGYTPLSQKIEEIPSNWEVTLEEDLKVLNEVVVTGLTAESIIQKAIAKIPDNYYQTPYVSKGFYRLRTKKGTEYIRLSEAAFELYYSRPTKDNQFKLNKMREIKDEKVLKDIQIGATAGGAFEIDMVNNDLKSLFGKQALKNHDFSIEGTIQYNGSEVYVISFDQKDNLRKSGFKGRLLIDTSTFAFLKIEKGLSSKGIKYNKFGGLALRALMEIMDIKLVVKKSEDEIIYRKIGDKYYISQASVDFDMGVSSSRKNYNYDAISRADYVITEIQIDNNTPFPEEDVLKKNKWIEKQDSFYDNNFWDSFNTVLSGPDFSTIAEKIDSRNKANSIKIQVADAIFKMPKNKALRVDSILGFYHTQGLFNGTALIESNGQIIHHKSYNNAVTNNKNTSQYRIGSTSKTFTAALIMQLASEGKLKVGDSIGTFLPEYKHGQVTIAQLLSHQSGIPNYHSNQTYLSEIISSPYDLDDLVKKYCSDSLEFTPGSQFRYSNSGFVLLAAIIEKVTDQSFNQTLKERIFTPLGMSGSYFGNTGDNQNLVKGYLYNKPEPSYPIQNVIGAGGIVSTSSDLLAWSKAIDANKILPEAVKKEMISPHAFYNGWEADYGYGWMIDRHNFSSSRKHKIYLHPGTDFGFYSMFVKQPDEEISIILLSNTGDFPRFEITDLILSELN